jgi:hypothetical protein
MISIYERPFPKDQNGPVRQFTSCCGASDKGTEDGVACRACYRLIDDYYGVGDEAAFLLTIKTPRLVKKFKALLAEPFETYDEWHAAFVERLYKTKE